MELDWDEANSALLEIGQAVVTGGVKLAVSLINELRLQALPKLQVVRAGLELVKVVYNSYVLEARDRVKLYRCINDQFSSSKILTTVPFYVSVLASDMKIEIIRDFMLELGLNYLEAFEALLKHTTNLRAYQQLDQVMSGTKNEYQILASYPDVTEEIRQIVVDNLAGLKTRARPNYVIDSDYSHYELLNDILANRDYEYGIDPMKIGRLLLKWVDKDSWFIINSDKPSRILGGAYKFWTSSPNVRKIVCQELKIDYPDYDHDLEYARRYGPYNPIDSDYNPLQGHMLTCFFNDNVSETGDQIIEDEDFAFDPDISWFTHICANCSAYIHHFHEAVRKPLTWNGWIGCFCQWSCVQKNCNDQELALAKLFESQMIELGLYDRSYPPPEAPPAHTLLTPFLGQLSESNSTQVRKLITDFYQEESDNALEVHFHGLGTQPHRAPCETSHQAVDLKIGAVDEPGLLLTKHNLKKTVESYRSYKLRTQGRKPVRPEIDSSSSDTETDPDSEIDIVAGETEDIGDEIVNVEDFEINDSE
jgi:hypothetical protein